MSIAHQGHVAGSGIQLHSAGKLFPWMIVVHNNTVQAMNGETGLRLQEFGFSEFGVQGDYQQARANAVASIPACWNPAKDQMSFDSFYKLVRDTYLHLFGEHVEGVKLSQSIYQKYLAGEIYIGQIAARVHNTLGQPGVL